MFRLSANRSFYTLAFMSVLLLNQTAFSADEPDLNREKRFHQIYKQYNLKPTSDATWRGVVSAQNQTYGIQEGDTLWDLSEALFGDPNFWPKVWSINVEKIENPHEIYPGLSVVFTPGTTEDAPSINVTPTKDLPPEQSVQEVPIATPENKELLEKTYIEPASPKSGPTPIPRSLPQWSHGQRKSTLKFEVQRLGKRIDSPDEPLPYYLSSTSPESAGTIVETEMSTLTASDYQYVSVQLPPGQTATSLIAVRELGKVKDPYYGADAYLVEVQGELEVLQVVNREENIYRALVKKALAPVEVGAKLLMGQMPTYSPKEGPQGSASARVIGGQDAVDRRIMATQNLIFLSGEGMAAGQTYPIYKHQKIRNEDSKLVENLAQIGKVKVVRVSGGLATALVLQSSEEIQVGDMTNPSAAKE